MEYPAPNDRHGPLSPNNHQGLPHDGKVFLPFNKASTSFSIFPLTPFVRSNVAHVESRMVMRLPAADHSSCAKHKYGRMTCVSLAASPLDVKAVHAAL